MCKLVREKSPILVFLYETKCSSVVIDSLKVSFGFFGVSILAHGRSGGLVLLANKNVSISLRGMSDRFIDVDISFSGTNIRFTGVYEQPNVGLRRNFCNSFKALNEPSVDPWICLGNFNEVFAQLKFQGHGVWNDWQIELFRDALNFCHYKKKYI